MGFLVFGKCFKQQSYVTCTRRTPGWWPSSKASSAAHSKIHVPLPNYTWNSVPSNERASPTKSMLITSGKRWNSWNRKSNWRRASLYLCVIKVSWRTERPPCAKANQYSKRKALSKSKLLTRTWLGAKSSTLCLQPTCSLCMTLKMNARNRWGKLIRPWWKIRGAHSSERTSKIERN